MGVARSGVPGKQLDPALAFFVLFATMFPTLSEAVTGERLTVGPPFFNKWMLPVGLVLLVLTGTGPLLAWRKSTLVNLKDQFLIPIATACRRGGAVIALGVPRVDIGNLFRTVRLRDRHDPAQEFWRGARVRQNATGTDLFTALIGLVGRNKRRCGGYIVHVAIVLMFLGFAGEASSRMSRCCSAWTAGTVGDFTIRLDADQSDRRRPEADDHWAHHNLPRRTGNRPDVSCQVVFPEARGPADHGSRDSANVLGGSLSRDACVQPPGTEREHGDRRRPAGQLVWVGFGFLALGTFIALLPEAAFSFAVARIPANAVTTSMLLLSLVLWPAAVMAQSGQQPAVKRVAH